jgi:hypothetical protein
MLLPSSKATVPEPVRTRKSSSVSTSVSVPGPASHRPTSPAEVVASGTKVPM